MSFCVGGRLPEMERERRIVNALLICMIVSSDSMRAFLYIHTLTQQPPVMELGKQFHCNKVLHSGFGPDQLGPLGVLSLSLSLSLFDKRPGHWDGASCGLTGALAPRSKGRCHSGRVRNAMADRPPHGSRECFASIPACAFYASTSTCAFLPGANAHAGANWRWCSLAAANRRAAPSGHSYHRW